MTPELEQLQAIYGTQEAIARAIGVSNQTVYRWLHGISKPLPVMITIMRQVIEKEGLK